MMSSMRIKSRENPNLEISVFRGHFVTRHSHNSHYLDITRMKHEYGMAADAASILFELPREQFDSRGLARARGSEEPEALAARNREREPVEHALGPEGEAHALHREDGSAPRCVSSCSHDAPPSCVRVCPICARRPCR